MAIFDADFEPPEDYLEEIIPRLYGDSGMAFVQTRWNSPSNSFLTWVQVWNRVGGCGWGMECSLLAFRQTEWISLCCFPQL